MTRTDPEDTDLQYGLAVRSRRAQLGITLDQLADASGVSSAALSRLERGLLGASLRNAMAVARGLGCELSELLGSPPAQIWRAGEHLRYTDANGVERLALASPSPGLSLVQYRLPPGSTSQHFAAHSAGTREVFYVIKGKLQVWTGAQTLQLQAGDSALLLMEQEHRLENVGRTEVQLILMVVTPGH